MKITKYIIPGILLFFLLFRLPIANFRLGYELSATYFSIIIFAIFLIHKKYFIPGSFLLLCVFASYYPLCSLTSLQSIRIVSIGVLLYFVLSEIKPDEQMIYNVLCIACLVNILFLTLQYFKIADPYLIFGIKSNMSIAGLTANSNEAGAIIALCAPAFFRDKWMFFLPVIVLGLILSQSFGGFLAVSLMVMALAYFSGYKIQSIVFLVVAVSFFILFIHVPGASQRLSVWIAAIKFYFKETLFTGFGLGHWQYISKKYLSEAYNGAYFSRAHNTFIQCWFELGFGFIVILGFYAKKLLFQAKEDIIFRMAIIGILVVCSTNSAFRINFLNGVIIITWLSIMESKWREDHVY